MKERIARINKKLKSIGLSLVTEDLIIEKVKDNVHDTLYILTRLNLPSEMEDWLIRYMSDVYRDLESIYHQYQDLPEGWVLKNPKEEEKLDKETYLELDHAIELYKLRQRQTPIAESVGLNPEWDFWAP